MSRGGRGEAVFDSNPASREADQKSDGAMLAGVEAIRVTGRARRAMSAPDGLARSGATVNELRLKPSTNAAASPIGQRTRCHAFGLAMVVRSG